MPVRQEFDATIKGLNNQYSQTGGMPDGALVEARNCIADRPGLIGKRRGFNRYGDRLISNLSALLEFRGRLIALDGGVMRYDSDGSGTWVAWGGGFEHPDALHRIKSAEKSENLYFTSKNGVYKNDALTNSPSLAGMPGALDIKLTATGADGWFTADMAVGYRIIWSREDANDNLLLGSPSYKVVVSNPMHLVAVSNFTSNLVRVTDKGHGFATGDIATVESEIDGYDIIGVFLKVQDADTYIYSLALPPEEPLADSTATVSLAKSKVTVEFSVPDDISPETKDSYEIYRTYMQPLVSAQFSIGDEMKRVVKKKVTAAEVAAKKVSYEDTTLEISLDNLSLYTSPSRETISQRNDRPPYCKDLALFKNHLFAANLRYKQELEIKLEENLAYDQTTEEPIIAVGDSITITTDDKSRTYTLASNEDIAEREFLLSTEESTPAVNVRETMKSLVRVINQHPSDTGLYAHYSSLESDAPGKVLLLTRNLRTPAFTVVAGSEAFGAMFEEEIPISGDDIKSTDSEDKAGVTYSKVDEPEAWPFANSFSVGSEQHEIHRIIPLRDSLIILKEDGVYRLTGETANTFVVRDLDRTVSIEAPETAVALNNAVFCLSTQGVLRIDENGTQVISWPIETEMRKAEQFSNQKTVSFAVGYETDRKYILWMPPASGGVLASKAWVFNYLTKEWTTWDKSASCGRVLSSDRKLYTCDPYYRYVLQERKSSNKRDLSIYMDESINVDAVAHSTTTDADGETVTTVTLPATEASVGWSYSKDIRAGFLFQATTAAGVPSWSSATGLVNKRGKVASVAVAKSPGGPGVPDIYQATLTLTEDIELSGTLTNAELSIPIDSYVRWAPADAGQRTMMKHFTYVALSFEEDSALTHEVGFYTDVVPEREWVNTVDLAAPTGWGDGPWGSDPWGDRDVRSTPVVSAVPRQHQRCRALTLLYRHRTVLEKFELQARGLMFRPYGGMIVRQSK